MSGIWNELEDFCDPQNPSQDAAEISEAPSHTKWLPLTSIVSQLQDWPNDMFQMSEVSNVAPGFSAPQTAENDENTDFSATTDADASYQYPFIAQIRPLHARFLHPNEHMVSYFSGSSQYGQNSHSPRTLDEYTQHNLYADRRPSSSTIDPYETSCMASETGSHHPAEQSTIADNRVDTTVAMNDRVSIPRTAASSDAKRQRAGDARFVCDLCGKDFGRIADLQRHKDDIHGLAKITYECVATGCRFSHCRLDKIKEHLRQTGHNYREVNTV